MALTTPLLERQFTQIVQPYLAKNCAGCHSGKTPAGSLDLKAYTSTDAVIRDYPRWATVHTRLAAGEMPPKPMAAPPVEESRKVLNWIQAVRTEELRKHAGDPGPVLVRRLSNAEYNYTIRDLTGADLRPAREFPVEDRKSTRLNSSHG